MTHQKQLFFPRSISSEEKLQEFLERLISDGRIHPARIEEVVEKVKQELEEEMIRDGENVVLQLVYTICI